MSLRQHFFIEVPLPTPEQALETCNALRALDDHSSLHIDLKDEKEFCKGLPERTDPAVGKVAFTLFECIRTFTSEDEDLSLRGLGWGYMPSRQGKDLPEGCESQISFSPKHFPDSKDDKYIHMGVMIGIVQHCQKAYGADAVAFKFHEDKGRQRKAGAIAVYPDKAPEYITLEDWADTALSAYRNEKAAGEEVAAEGRAAPPPAPEAGMSP